MNREYYDECMMEAIARHLVLERFDDDKDDCMFQLVGMGILGREYMLGRDLVIAVVCATMMKMMDLRNS